MTDRPVPWGLPRVVLAALAVASGLALVVAASTSTAAFGAYNPAWDGASDLRGSDRNRSTAFGTGSGRTSTAP